MKIDFMNNVYLMSLGIDGITKILQVVMIALIIGAAGFFVYMKFFKKKGKNVSSTDDDEMKGNNPKVLHTKEFIPVESIKNGIMKLEGEDRYIASINCKGFDLATANPAERLKAQAEYRSFVNTIQSPITLRIDSTAVDLTPQIQRFERIRQQRVAERNLKQEQFIELRDKERKTPDGPEKMRYDELLIKLDDELTVLEKKILHLDSLIRYETELSGRNANPVQEERYIIDWEFNPDDYPPNITPEEIFEKAQTNLGTRLGNMSNTLSGAFVKCRRDNDEDLFNLNYRHFHPFGGDYYKYNEVTTAEGGIVSGYKNYEAAMKRYEEIKQSDEWKIIEEKMRKMQEEARAAAESEDAVLDDDDEEGELLGSGTEKTMIEDEGGMSF